MEKLYLLDIVGDTPDQIYGFRVTPKELEVRKQVVKNLGGCVINAVGISGLPLIKNIYKELNTHPIVMAVGEEESERYSIQIAFNENVQGQLIKVHGDLANRMLTASGLGDYWHGDTKAGNAIRFEEEMKERKAKRLATGRKQ